MFKVVVLPSGEEQYFYNDRRVSLKEYMELAKAPQ